MAVPTCSWTRPPAEHLPRLTMRLPTSCVREWHPPISRCSRGSRTSCRKRLRPADARARPAGRRRHSSGNADAAFFEEAETASLFDSNTSSSPGLERTSEACWHCNPTMKRK